MELTPLINAALESLELLRNRFLKYSTHDINREPERKFSFNKIQMMK